MLLSRVFLSLVAALSLCTLATANSVPVNVTILHSGAGVVAGACARTTLNAFDSPTTRTSWNAHFAGPLSKVPFAQGVTAYRATRFTFQGEGHGTRRYRVGGWVVWNRRTAMSTPEPGSLMLLSTGLLGVAGMMRRKLLRG